jgi:hypothetical protein
MRYVCKGVRYLNGGSGTVRTDYCRGVGRVLGDGLALRLSSGVGEQQQQQQQQQEK